MRFAAALLLAAPATALSQQAEETPICTDRPTKANAVCTVPVGKWQLESSAASWSRTKADGTETKILSLGSSVLKLGLSDRSDLQVGFTPHIRARTKIGGIKSSASGFGDLTVRYKHRLTVDEAPVQVGVIPFVKLPTADGDIGNGKVEGGLAVPISIATASPVTVVLGPELDLLADADGDGHHAALVNLVNVSGPIANGLTLYGELWTQTNFDPADTVTLASADAALAWLVGGKFQLDVGANIGLTRNTADLEVYGGASLRF
ncbi:MAG TPA: transporter [Sphingomicrobium sp.]|nr:transporter [Sphingomicrobium sp.]